MLRHYIIVGLVLGTAYSTEQPEKGCVNHPLSACPILDSKNNQVCHCKRIEADTTIICCHIQLEDDLKKGFECAQKSNNTNRKKENMLPGQQESKIQTPVTALHILNATLERLDISAAYLQNLISLSVTQGNISRITGKFPSRITCLNLTSNHLEEMDPQAFTNMPQLGYLDLSNNNLTRPPELALHNSKTHFLLNLSGNRNLNCLYIHELLNTQIHFINENETFCSAKASFNWFQSIEVIPFHQLEAIANIDKTCPRSSTYECNCTTIRNVHLVIDGKTQYSVAVDCSGRGLTSLPEILPPHTMSLNISNNQITNFKGLGSYNYIDKLYADNNRIESLTELEGTQFIDKFLQMSLRNNSIKTIPKYLLENVFDRNNFNLKSLMLGKNKLLCDCSTAQDLKVWLLANKQCIPDYEDLFCENFESTRVVELDKAKVCVYPRDWTDYLYYIIALETFLLILLFTKVSYDYWVFKTKGYLPWPASKMPRMPCDWVFE